MQSIRLYISPYFLSRYYRLQDLKLILKSIKLPGRVLDVGCGSQPYRNLFDGSKYEGIDFNSYSLNKDFGAHAPDHFFPESYVDDLTLPFQAGTFDHVVSFQVIEHHPEPQMMISEISRVMRPKGYLILSSPFLGGLHEEPHDYNRLTIYALKRVLEKNDFEVVSIKPEGSLFSTIAMLYNEHLNAFASINKFCYWLSVAIYPLFLLNSYLALGLDKIVVTDKIVFNYMILAKKL